MFSKACEYAIRATIFIAGQSMKGLKAGQKEIAQAIEGPEAFTAKTLQKLSRSRVVSSDKGPNGGFYLSPQQLNDICLIHIVEAIDGNEMFHACGLGLKACNSQRPCPVHFQYKKVRDGLLHMLTTTNVRDLAMDLKKGEAFLTR